jgi:trimeric autotransporter adhesin
MSVVRHRISLAWFSFGVFASLAHIGCGEPLFDVDSDDPMGEMPSGGTSSLSPDAGAPGAAGTFPVVPLPGGGRGGASGIAAGGAAAGGPVAGVDGGVPIDSAAAIAAGSAYLITASRRLMLIDPVNGASLADAAMTGIAADDALIGADFRPADRMLYAIARSGAIYRIDVSSAVASPIGTLVADTSDTTAPYAGLDGTSFGVDFNPVVDRLRVVSDTGQNLRINVDTAEAITDAALNPGAPSVTAVAYSNAFGAACRTRLYGVDLVTGQLVLHDPPNDGKLTAIGSLGLTGMPAGSAAFDVYTSADGAHRSALLVEVDGVPTLFDLNLGTGAATTPRAIDLDPTDRVIAFASAPSLTAPAQAPGDLIGMSESGRLVSFNRAAPAKLCTSVAVSGLAASERLLGIDVRPANGALYALGSAGNVYTLDVASGAATARATLTADATDTTEPYAGLSDADYGIGFNPVPDRLRAIGSAGQNLRINVDTGATFTDTVVYGPALGAVAYANAFAGAKSTTLFAIDAAADALVRVGGDPATGGACPSDPGNPNCGVVTAIGVLGHDASTVVGFDIDGKTGVLGSALIASSPAGASSSSLYVVDLDTGAASAPAALANTTIGGGERIGSLTLARDPVLEAHAVTTDGQLLAFSPRTPERLDSAIPIRNLDDGDTLIGLDRRSADNVLYALGASGSLYTIDPASGAATVLGSLSAAAADDNPFSGFDPRASHGVDFNPAADLLRVVSDWGQNLRIVPSARSLGTPPLAQVVGATFTDLDLNPNFPSLVASAYTNAFAGTTRTSLFGIDSLSDQLVRQGGPDGSPSPNTGTLTPIGSLGVDAVEASFDIAGGRNGVALAVIETIDAPPSVYSLSLATGAATPFNAAGNNPIGDGSVDLHIVGVALQLR